MSIQPEMFPGEHAPVRKRPAEPPLDIDVRDFIQLLRHHGETKWQVTGIGRRGGEIGIAVANVALVHSNGYEVILKFPDGKLDSFAPFNLMPPL